MMVAYGTGEDVAETHNVLICSHNDINEAYSGLSNPCRFLNQLV